MDHQNENRAPLKSSTGQEKPVTQSKEGKDASPAKSDLNRRNWRKRLGHWMRVAVMFLSGGFIFPHVLIEDEDIANNCAEKDAKDKKR